MNIEQFRENLRARITKAHTNMQTERRRAPQTGDANYYQGYADGLAKAIDLTYEQSSPGCWREVAEGGLTRDR